MAPDVRRGFRREEVAIDTIYALSSGSPPAAIAVIRISGTKAGPALERLCGRLPEPRVARLATLRNQGEVIDNALVIWFPGPGSATGEDSAELHLHGGRSVVTAALQALNTFEGLRAAEPGEFTRRAFENGRIDLTEAEGLADLLMSETQSQRRAALALAGGALSRDVERWQSELLCLAAAVEALLDFGDEGDVEEELPASWHRRLDALSAELDARLRRPTAERLRDGVRVVIAGPPNAGKSTLLNALVGREAAITSDIPGTTRDALEAPAAIGGAPFLLIDTAGIRQSEDTIEAIGVERARRRMEDADIVLWLGPPEDAPACDGVLRVSAQVDRFPRAANTDIPISAVTGEGMDRLVESLKAKAAGLLPRESEVAINARHHSLIGVTLDSLRHAGTTGDLLIRAEALRQARGALDQITGRAGVEAMLDSLFGRFCIGK